MRELPSTLTEIPYLFTGIPKREKRDVNYRYNFHAGRSTRQKDIRTPGQKAAPFPDFELLIPY